MPKNTDKFRSLQKHYLSVLKEKAKQRNVTQEQISQTTGLSQPNVSRMLDGRYAISFVNFLRLSTAIDCHILIIDNP